jgi:hypothetical protein
MAIRVRERIGERFERGRSPWALAWPGVAGCAILFLEATFHLLDPRSPFLIGPASPFTILLALPLFLCSIGALLLAVGEPHAVGRPALLANGGFLVVTGAIFWFLVVCG